MDLTCPTCNDVFSVPPWRVREGARFCSSGCAGLAGADARRGNGLGADVAINCTRTPSGCLEWNHARDAKGYGILTHNGLSFRAHRLVCEATYGPAPTGKPWARHTCDNPPCCEPTHLRWGSPAENSRDMIERERHPRGEQRWNAVLTTTSAASIKARLAAGERACDLAREFGVAPGTLYDLKHGRTWTHV